MPVQNGGSRIVLPSCIVLIAARADAEPARLGVTVTRKFGGAVARNRAKRLMRELFRRSPDLFPNGVDLVVIPKAPRASGRSFSELEGEWRKVGGLLAARAESLRRALAKSPPATHTGSSRRARQGKNR